MSASWLKIITRTQAKEFGLEKYFTGTVCKNGHLEHRITRCSRCVVCKRVSHQKSKIRCKQKNNLTRQVLRQTRRASGCDKEREYNNKPEVKAKKNATSAKWKKDNRDRVNARRRHLRSKNRDAELQKRRDYGKTAKAKATARAWYLGNKERKHAIENLRRRKSYPQNREKQIARNRNRRAKKKGCNGTHTKCDILDLMRLQKQKCASCGGKISFMPKNHKKKATVDHIMPLKLGGRNDKKNLQILCLSCNCSKEAKHPIDWAQKNGLLL